MIDLSFLDGLMLEIYRTFLWSLIMNGIFAGIIFRRLHYNFARRPWWRPCCGLLLGLWGAVVLWETVFSRTAGSVFEAHWIPLHTYRAIFSGNHLELLRSNFMNVLLFFPAGLLWAGLERRMPRLRRGLGRVAAFFLLFSMGIELTQFSFRLGVMEMDDILHNTLGAMIGYAAFRLDMT